MALLAILAAVLVIGVPLAVIFLMVSHAELKKRVASLEERLTEAREPENSSSLSTNPQGGGAASKGSPGAVTPLELPAQPDRDRGGGASSSEASFTAMLPAAATRPLGEPSRTVTLGQDRIEALFSWLAKNWFYAVSAISLALAGIFLVQHGIERGLLPPWSRVTAAVLFGLVLLAAGEFIRRRFGDDEESSTAYLPSTFSSAGLVTLFGAVLSARALYGLIGAEVALFGMAVTGAVALVFGWFYGPLLAAIGIVGATAAPFLVGGNSEDPSWLLGYFAIITVVGLGIDTMRRWAWVSVLSLVLGFGAGAFLALGYGQSSPVYLLFIVYCALLALAAIAIPVRSLTWPNHGGSMLGLSLLARREGDPWPEFPTRLSGGALLAACGLILLATFGTTRSDLFWTATVVLTCLALALFVWARDAPALTDQIAIPALSLVVGVVLGRTVWSSLELAAAEPETDLPFMATIVVAIGLLLSGVAGWRSLSRDAAHLYVAACAAILAPALAIAIEVFWQPANTLGAYTWALHAMVVAALMVVLAERFAKADGEERRLRMSFAVLSAMSSKAFAFVLMFTTTALTIALAVTVVGAVWLDRRFNLPFLGFYTLAGVATVGFRLVVEPGIAWAESAPIAEVILSYVGSMLAFVIAWWLVSQIERPREQVLLESAVFSTLGVTLSLLVYRAIESAVGDAGVETHWHLGMGAAVWMSLGLAQLRRLELGGKLLIVRQILAGAFLIIGGLQAFLAITVFNPLFEGNPVSGPPLLNTLAPAYLLPAVLLIIGARWLKHLPDWSRLLMTSATTALASLWFALGIRHFWRGGDAMALPGIEQPELYSYTVAILTVGAALFYLSLARKNTVLRKLGLAVIGVAAAKVFLVDIAGLGGLIRVFSLLLLGLSLAALAWLNRWADGKQPASESLGETSSS